MNLFLNIIIILVILTVLYAIYFEFKRYKNRGKKRPDYKSHLEKTFLEELSYKLWITKGSRFIANKRLLTQANLSNISIALLSSYLIIAGLITVYQLNFTKLIDSNLLAFGSTALSILVLVFSQIESAGDYKLKAIKFHDCALELGRLYNEVRRYKTLNENATSDEINAFCREIDAKYQQILKEHDNHSPADYDRFMIENKEYFKHDAFEDIKLRVYIFVKTTLIYYSLIFIPLLTTLYFFIYSN